MEVAPPNGSQGPVDQVDTAFAAMCRASADLLAAIARFDETQGWRRDGATSMTSWLAGRYGLAWGGARELLRVARAVKDLPAIAERHRRGYLPMDKVRPLARFATPETDEHWSRRAARLRPSSLWREAERHQRRSAREDEDIHRRRFLSLWWDREGPVLYLEGRLGAEQGAALETALRRRAESVVLADAPEDREGARLADALIEAAAGSSETGLAADRVVIHADAHVVSGRAPTEGPWLAETECGRRLSAEAIRRLACDGRIEWVLEAGGRPVGIGRRGRVVPGQVARLLRFRDGGACRFPGCERRSWLQAHHLLHWGDGGGTNLDNLVLLCWAHHRLLHEGGWRTSGHPGRDFRFHDPTGRPLRTMAEAVQPGIRAGPAAAG